MSENVVSSNQLKQIIEKIERLEVEKANITEDIQAVYAEAKSYGLDTHTLKQVIKIKKMDKSKFKEQEELLETYLSALGIIKSC
ncbi:DUF2312 domain-containing protein [Orientia tsutsugamushi]|uniref:GapR-like DNA-binding domain-containing protein n=2 Tax=Orientia tsutsugamushi TaxID=784 RepID=A5CDI5_ORITB|nr:DUF2312 domain-containing protein [Orientia tsutsugamushi]CAM79926.1 conserved hypothetical protein [Orientia tsutsugamushi str. Boryong]SPR04479.1 Uncharacterised protein [Orientia tsutsugamushi str. Gilliam]